MRQQVAELWSSKRADIVDSAEDTMRQLRAALEPKPAAEGGAAAAIAAEDAPAAARAALARCVADLAKRYDAARAGFGCAPGCARTHPPMRL